MKLPPPPSLLHICRFFNTLCEDTVKLILGIGGILLLFVVFILGIISIIGYLVFHLVGDPFNTVARTDAILMTGAIASEIAIVAGILITALWLIFSTLRDLWKKSGRETSGDKN